MEDDGDDKRPKRPQMRRLGVFFFSSYINLLLHILFVDGRVSDGQLNLTVARRGSSQSPRHHQHVGSGSEWISRRLPKPSQSPRHHHQRRRQAAANKYQGVGEHSRISFFFLSFSSSTTSNYFYSLPTTGSVTTTSPPTTRWEAATRCQNREQGTRSAS